MQNVWNNGRKFAKVAGVLVLGVGLFAGGCNKAIKEENANLTAENVKLREDNAQLQATNAALMSQGQGRSYEGDSSPGRRSSGDSGRQEQVIVISGDVLFDAGKTTVKSSAKKELDKAVSTIKSSHSGRTVKVIGHTDKQPIKKSKWGSNEALSEARAEAVADYLASKGIPRSSITTIGKGAKELKATDAASRRVEIVIVD